MLIADQRFDSSAAYRQITNQCAIFSDGAHDGGLLLTTNETSLMQS